MSSPKHSLPIQHRARLRGPRPSRPRTRRAPDAARIVTDEGAEGDAFGGSPDVIEGLVKPLLMGEDPFYRERIWQTLKERQRLHMGSSRTGCCAPSTWRCGTWPGSTLGQPVYKLLGGTGTRSWPMPARCAATTCPAGWTRRRPMPALRCGAWQRGYPAFKLHTWQPPMPGAPDPKRDVAACAAVREAVGDEMALMLDPFHYYTREQALYLGRELEKLGYYWIEEPMDEHSISSYVWLTEQLDIPIVGPETAEGKMYTRAEWIVRGASDISRGGVGDVGGITPLMKVVHLCESFGVRLEVHGGGAGNLHALCAMGIPGEYYERGCCIPSSTTTAPAVAEQLVDPMDDEGYVHVSQQPGLGMDINWDYIEDNLV